MKSLKYIVLAAACALCFLFGGMPMGAVADDGEILQDPVLVTSSDTTVVADIVLTEEPYSADKTGKEDATKALKDAIAALKEKGGGTIYLPEGYYRITGSITVENYVNIVGDYHDPDGFDGEKDYGTVIIADVAKSTSGTSGLFRLRANTGVVGITVWYPDQLIDDVRPYPYTFEIMGGAFTILEHIQFTIMNVTLINAYKGVCASRTVNPQVQIGRQDAHEGLVIENLKGTVLKCGVDSVNESDIGYFKNITFSPKYWAEAPERFAPPAREKIAAYTEENAAGLKLGDLEWSPYYDITVENFKTGVHIIEGTRIQEENPIAFMGGFYNLTVSDCKYGLVADQLYIGWGMLVTRSSISGSEAAVINNAPVGYIRLSDVKTHGAVAGERIYINNAKVPEAATKTPEPLKPASRLFDVVKTYGAAGDGETDDTKAIKKALSAASGGGIVYLRAGYYRVTENLVVPQGVELRGCMNVTNRDTLGLSGGTVIFCYADDAVSDNQNATAFITLNKNSALSGLRICYPDNNLWMTAPGVYAINATPYTVRAVGDGARVINVGLVNSYNGINVKNADNCVIKNVPALFFNTGIRVDDSLNCHIENVFSNATVATQSGFHSSFPDIFKNGWLWRVNNLWNYYTYTETHTQIIDLHNSTNVNIMSVFTFCSAGIVKAENSSFTMNGCGADRMWANGTVLNVADSKAQVINQLKYHCAFMKIAGASEISIYGRMNLHLAEAAEVKSESEYNMVKNKISEDTVAKVSGSAVRVTYPVDTMPVQSFNGINPISEILKELR